MYRDPHDSHYTKEPTDPSWRSLAVCYALMATTVLALWSIPNPLVGAAVFTSAAVLLAGTRKVVPLVRCLAACGGFVLEVTEDLQICVVRPSADGPC